MAGYENHRNVDGTVLAERVRACMGRVVSHPGAIDVTASEGRVVLSGAVLAHEYRALMRAAQSARGVRQVEDRLSVHEEPTGIPELQGGRPRRPRRFELLQENWAPATRLVTSTAGGALVLYGFRNRTLPGLLVAAVGGALLIRGTMNVPLKRLAGATGRRAIDVRKTIHFDAPVERVFETLAHYESYPLVMHNVRTVRMHADGRSHWTVAGPGGVAVEWDSETTAFEPNRLIAWRTVRNSQVPHAGTMRFEPFAGGTRLTIRMSYNPPAGALGHVVARLFGADPKSELDQDLVRLKTFIETGKRPRDAAQHPATAYTPVSGAAPETPPPAAAEPDAAQPLPAAATLRETGSHELRH